MSKITVLNEKAICCTVQSLAWGFNIWEATMSLKGYKKGDLYLMWMNGTKGEKEKLPPGQWSIEGRASEINSGILEKIFPHPTLSGISAMCECLKSKGLNPAEIIILIKQ